MKKIVCIGQSALDVTLPVDSFPLENTKVRINDRRIISGGGACNNAAYLLGMWQNDVTLLSSVGNDHDGKFLEEEIKEAHVKPIFYKDLNISTTTSYIITNLSNSTRTIITNRNKNLKYETYNDINISCDYILVDGNEFDLSNKVFNDNPNAIKIIDAGSNKPYTTPLAKECDYIVASSDYAKEVIGFDFELADFEKLKVVYDNIQKLFKGTLIITLESYGSMVKIDNEFHFVESIKVDSVDSNGAGDIYHGAFVHFLAKGYPLLDTMRLANITGALSTKSLGTRNSIPDEAEVIKIYESR